MLHASTQSSLADLSYEIKNGVHAAKTACEDCRLSHDAAATEIAFRLALVELKDTCP